MILRSQTISFKLFQLLLYLLFLIDKQINCWPLNGKIDHLSSRARRELIDDNAQLYLMRYGYLPMSDMETGNLRTEKQLRDAIKIMQRFGQLPQTGHLDRATRRLMHRPRCSLPDVLPDEFETEENEIYGRRVRRYVKQGNVWDHFNLSYSIRSYPQQLRDHTRNPHHMTKFEVTREFQLATEVWARVSRLDFHKLDHNVNEADIIIDFHEGYHADGYPFDGPGNTLAHAFYPGGGDIGGDMHFDSEEPWVQHKDANSTLLDISLFITAAHELGHALGLYHSDVVDSLMNPYLRTFPRDFHLPDDDRLAIQDLYGIADDWKPATKKISEDLPSTPKQEPTFRPRPTTPRRPLEENTEKPDTCDTDYDAISIIRREIYIFKGRYFWRVDGKGKPRPNYPAEIIRFWQMLPKNLTNVDAVYERSHDGNIVFFIGQRYYICHGNDELIETGPLRRLGLPKDLQKIDAAFVWGHSGRTYFFADTMYWRFEEGNISHVELDYPRDMVMWRGVPYNIDAAFKYNGTTYFFKGRKFYEFDDLRMRVTPRSPLLSAPFWFNCPNSFQNPYYPGAGKQVSSGYRLNPGTVLVMLLSISHWLNQRPG